MVACFVPNIKACLIYFAQDTTPMIVRPVSAKEEMTSFLRYYRLLCATGMECSKPNKKHHQMINKKELQEVQEEIY